MRQFLAGLALFATLAACAAGGITANPATGSAPDPLAAGHGLMAAGKYEPALQAYYLAAGQSGMTVDVLSALGSANLALGRLGQAETLLRRALATDPAFVPALNNLGVVLMERGQSGEARVIFQQAFALDSGQTDSIRENLRRAIAQSRSALYDGAQEKPAFHLVRRGQGQYVLLSRPQPEDAAVR